MHVVNTFRTLNGPPKFCMELEADWLIVLDEAHTKSPGRFLLFKGGEEKKLELKRPQTPHSFRSPGTWLSHVGNMPITQNGQKSGNLDTLNPCLTPSSS